MNTTPLIIYHRADYDGKISRDICIHWLPGTMLESDTIGWDYGDPAPDISDRSTVYLVDISIPELLVPENRLKIIWIDHHASAIAKFGESWEGVRIDGVAACRLCWQWFQCAQAGERLPSKADFVDRVVKEPELVRLAGEYDVWDKRDPNADTLQYGLRACRVESIDVRHYLFLATNPAAANTPDSDDFLMDWLVAGKAAQRYAEGLNASMAHRSYEIQWEGLRWLALNTSLGNSDTFEAAVKPHHQALLMWRWDGQRCKVSLYHSPHRKDLDLSKIAVAHGGGGHRGACGFESFFIPGELLRAAEPISR